MYLYVYYTYLFYKLGNLFVEKCISDRSIVGVCACVRCEGASLAFGTSCGKSSILNIVNMTYKNKIGIFL